MQNARQMSSLAFCEKNACFKLEVQPSTANFIGGALLGIGIGYGISIWENKPKKALKSKLKNKSK
jgi:hypothetical protein